MSFDELLYAKPEPHRASRQGFPEAIYCPGKTTAQIVSIFRSLMKGPGPVLATRIREDDALAITRSIRGARHFPVARLVVAKPRRVRGRDLCVVCAGTADLSVAEEAAVTAEALGCKVKRLFDVGVSGIHRLMGSRGLFTRAGAIIVCAGMEGALPSVVGGLAACPVIAVPTSVGYGAHFNGLAPLLAMLNSCAANVTTVNIDNGFGAGVVASLIVR